MFHRIFLRSSFRSRTRKPRSAFTKRSTDCRRRRPTMPSVRKYPAGHRTVRKSSRASCTACWLILRMHPGWVIWSFRFLAVVHLFTLSRFKYVFFETSVPGVKRLSTAQPRWLAVHDHSARDAPPEAVSEAPQPCQEAGDLVTQRAHAVERGRPGTLLSTAPPEHPRRRPQRAKSRGLAVGPGRLHREPVR